MGITAESKQTSHIPSKVDGRAATESPAPVWEHIGARKRALLSASIPQEWRVPADLLPPDAQDDVTAWPATSSWFNQEELDITEQTATQLVAKLASGVLTSETVTRAFCKRAAAAHQLVCIRNDLIDKPRLIARLGKLPLRDLL